MKQYYSINDSSPPATTESRWNPFLFCKTRNGKVISFTVLLLIAVIVLAITLASTGDYATSRQSTNAASVETTNNFKVTRSPATVIVPIKSPSSQPITLTDAPVSNPPSPSPTTIPSVLPSMEPTVRETDDPTASPIQPSSTPTVTPSVEPTVSPTTSSPTFAPIVVPNFRIKLHWEPHYFWQDEAIERRWCVECTTCPYLNFDETNCWCDYVPQCGVGNQIWIVDCDFGFGQIFTVRPITPEYHQIQVVPHNYSASYNKSYVPSLEEAQPDLCLHRTETRFVTAQPCQNFTYPVTNETLTKDQKAQLFDPIPYDQYNVPFTITPAIPLPLDKNIPWCLTNQHHPKTDEIVALKHCSLAMESHTGYWNVYPPP